MGTVLLVDDNSADRALFRRILGGAGLVVHEVSRGSEALDEIRRLRPHVVVLDINLPDVEGHDVCRAIRADPICSGVPVLMLTVQHHERDILAGLAAGADDYVAKDEAAPIIVARIQRLVRYRFMSQSAALNEQLAQIGRLVAGIVHEIRGPLSVVRGHAELMLIEQEANAASVPWIETMLRNIELLQQRLEYLMSAARTGASLPVPVDCNALIKEAINLFHRGIDPLRKQISINYLPPTAPLKIMADSGRLVQALICLLSNAHQAVVGRRPDGRIEVKVLLEPVEESNSDSPQMVRVDILDNGPGISADVLERVFEPFFTTKPGGTGYGLYLASEIVREHGGRMTARNHEDGGACLMLWLPYAAEVPAVAAAEPADSG